MPVTLSFEEPSRFVAEATGKVTGAEAIEAIQTVLRDPRFRPGGTLLVLAQNITAVPPTHELREIASTVVALQQAGLAGFVIVSQPGFVYGVARMFSALADLVGVSVEVFLDQCEARARLDEISARAA